MRYPTGPGNPTDAPQKTRPSIHYLLFRKKPDPSELTFPERDRTLTNNADEEEAENYGIKQRTCKTVGGHIVSDYRANGSGLSIHQRRTGKRARSHQGAARARET